MRFSDFTGNSDSVDRLKTQVRLGRVFHAYIFEGADGIGKKKLAYTFAQALMCEDPQDGEPCCECAACRKAMSGNHVDIHYITKSGQSIKTEDFKKEILEYTQMKPFDGNRSVYIIDEADSMGVAVQNKFLKTLEEPGPGIVIIMLTANINGLLPTIISRSAVMRLKPVETGKIVKLLTEKQHTDTKTAEIAASYSYGNPGKAIRLIQDEEFTARRERAIRCAKGLIENISLAEFFALAESDADNRDGAKELLEMMIFWYRDLMLLKSGADESSLMNRDHLDELRKSGASIDLRRICRILEKLEAAKYDILMNGIVKYVIKNAYIEIN